MSPPSARHRGLPKGLLLVGAGLSLWALAAACGNDRVAPRPEPAAQSAGCRGFEQLMPRFVGAITTGRTEGLRQVIEEHLLVPARPGDPPPINDVMRAVFLTLSGFARLPPEAGALSGQTCVAPGGATPLPPVERANPLCEMRRAMDSLVHEGKGGQALKLTDPLIAGVMSYLIGRMPSSATPHYEVSAVVASMCAQNGVCQLSDGLDLVVGLTAFAELPEGKAALDRLSGLAKNPALQPFLTNDGAQYGGENGVVALVKVVLTTVLGMRDPAELDSLPIDQLPAALQPDLRAALADMKLLLDPNRRPNVLSPLKAAANCYTVQDKNLDLVRMIYRLALVQKLPEFGLTGLTATLQGVRDTDARGTLVHLVRVLAEAVRSDEQAIDSAAKVCQTLFSTRTSSTQTHSNAELALPVVADLFSQGVAAEALCAADTLIYGCAGGPQPACGR
ncbi:MAG: hypothetical protein ACYC8T_03465 [Myxococcaceae bacterium]